MNRTLLLVEDNEDDAFFVRRALQQAQVNVALQHVADGAQAIAYLSGEGAFADRGRFPLPGLVLLDLNLPYRTGLQVLEWIRQQPEFATLVVIVFTSSSEEADVRRAAALGANSYVVKPSSTELLLEFARGLKLWWLDAHYSAPATRAERAGLLYGLPAR